MITINSNTKKKDLLNQLAKAADEEGTLFVNLESRPNFLATPISFTIFNYQISNYPRKLVWNSNRPEIRNFLRDCHVEYVDHQISGHSSQDDDETEEIFDIISETSDDIETPSKQAKTTPDNFQQEPFWQGNQTTQNHPPTSNFQATSKEEHQEPESRQNTPQDQSQYHTFINVNQPNQEQANFQITPKKDFVDPNEVSRDIVPSAGSVAFSANELLKKESYKPSLLLDKLENNDSTPEPKPTHPWQVNQSELKPISQPESQPTKADPNFNITYPQTDSKQNLDHWLERIESTRKALNSNRFQPAKASNPVFSVMRFSTVSAVLSLIISGVILFFPTSVYSLEITSLEAQDALPVSINLEEMGLRETQIESTSSIQPSGQETTTLSRARGEVVITNTSGSTVSFDKGGIVLRASNGQEYTHIPKNSEPGTFRVPARSNINGGNLTIEIESIEAGGELAAGETLRLYNLKRDLIGTAISAQVTDEGIVTEAITGNLFVNESDQQSLREKANQELGSLINQEIASLSENSRLVTDPSWYTTGEITYNFSHAVGDTTPELTVSTTTPVTFYTLPQEVLLDKIRSQNPEVETVTSIDEIVKDSEFNSTNPDGVDLQVQYTYIKKNNLNQEEIARILSSEDFETAKEELRQEFPEIQNVEIQNQGVNLPGVPQRVNLEFEEEDL
jgi:hypothetical protein